MYSRTYWLDHVVSPSDTYAVVINGDGTEKITRTGTVMQQGTPKDQAHFNNMEEGIFDGQLMANLLLNYARQMGWDIETGTKTLTNTATYPFNNSQSTVALAKAKESTNYIVLIQSVTPDFAVGDIKITDKLINGFKMAYDGSASTATIVYTVISGYMK
jgi:hypothetical protein